MADRRVLADGYPLSPSSGTPRPVKEIQDGRSPDLRVHASPTLPGQFGQWIISEQLTAHSCGGSCGFGAYWLHHTAFPFHQPDIFGPAETVPSRIIKRTAGIKPNRKLRIGSIPELRGCTLYQLLRSGDPSRIAVRRQDQGQMVARFRIGHGEAQDDFIQRMWRRHRFPIPIGTG